MGYPRRSAPQASGWASRIRTFMNTVLRMPPQGGRDEVAAQEARLIEPPPSAPAGTLPCDVLLTVGWGSISLFEAGDVDAFSFFQRGGVSPRSDVEFLTRLDPEDFGTENYKAFGLVRLRQSYAEQVPSLGSLTDFWRSLKRRYGIDTVPRARALVGGEFSIYDPNTASGGVNRVQAQQPERVFARVGPRRFTLGDMLEILRCELSDEQKITWIEGDFQAPPAATEIVHRYYMTCDRQPYVVRHHWRDGKSLYRAETTAAARETVRASGVFSRPASMRRAA
ncbi:MAG: hypothetical protein KDD82_21865 [Planctomycetes bacterium]|nr:hypothetical protein [Planctomycetota bacterium]